MTSRSNSQARRRFNGGLPVTSLGRRSQRSSPLSQQALALPAEHDSDDNEDDHFRPPASYLAKKRPSWAPSLPYNEEAVEDEEGSPVTDSGTRGNVDKALQIDMKGLVGDALGNVGLYFLDLDG